MLITSAQRIAGQPILKIRQVLRQVRGATDLTYLATRYCHIGPHKAAVVIAALEASGYVRPATPASAPGFWILTPEGASLAQAAARPIRRRTAERTLAALLTRAERVGKDDYFLYRVNRIGVFGSYLSDAEFLGDLDIAIRMMPKERDQTRREQLFADRVEAAQAAGRRFGNFSQELEWPLRETLMFLRRHSPIISFHDLDDDRMLQRVPIRWVYSHRTGIFRRPRLVQPSVSAEVPRSSP